MNDRELLEDIHRIVLEMRDDLYGKPGRGIKGVVPLSRENASRLDAYDDLRNRAIGAGVGLGLISGMGGGILLRLFT